MFHLILVVKFRSGRKQNRVVKVQSIRICGSFCRCLGPHVYSTNEVPRNFLFQVEYSNWLKGTSRYQRMCLAQTEVDKPSLLYGMFWLRSFAILCSTIGQHLRRYASPFAFPFFAVLFRVIQVFVI